MGSQTQDDDQQRRAAGMAASRRRRSRAEEDEENDKPNFLSRIWNFLTGWMPDVGFFELIFIALAVGGLYLAAKANPEWADKLVDFLPESMQLAVRGILNKIGIDADLHEPLKKLALPELHKTLADQKVPKEVIDIIADKKETFDGFLNLVANANKSKDAQGKEVKGRVTLDTITNANTVFALLTEKPEMAQKLTAALLKPGSTAATSDTAKEILKSLQEITGGPRLDVLMGAQNRKNTLDLLRKLPGVDEKDIKFLTDLYAKNPDDVRKLLPKLLTIGADGKLPDPKKVLYSLMQTDQQFAASVQAVAMNDPEIQKLLATPEAQALVSKLGLPKLQELQALAISDTSGKAAAAFMLKPEHIGALPELLAFAVKNPEQVKLPVDAKALNTLVQAGMKNGQPGPALTALYAEMTKAGELSLEKMEAPLSKYILSREVAATPEASTIAIKNLIASIKTEGLDQQLTASVNSLKALSQKLTAPMLPILSRMAEQSGTNPLPILSVFTPEAGKKLTINQALGVLSVPKIREAVQAMGTANMAELAKHVAGTPAYLNKQNLDAMIQFAANIDTNRDNADGNATRTHNVLSAFVSAIDGASAKDAFKTLTAEELSGFFQSAGNHEAFKALLKTIDRTSLPPAQQAQVAALDRFIGDHKRHGWTNLLADPKGAKFFLAKLQEPANNMPDIVKRGALAWEGGSIATNAEIVLELSKIFQNTGTSVNAAADTDATLPYRPMAPTPGRTYPQTSGQNTTPART